MHMSVSGGRRASLQWQSKNLLQCYHRKKDLQHQCRLEYQQTSPRNSQENCSQSCEPVNGDGLIGTPRETRSLCPLGVCCFRSFVDLVKGCLKDEPNIYVGIALLYCLHLATIFARQSPLYL